MSDQPVIDFKRGFGFLFARHVTQAHEGCYFDFLHQGADIPDPKIH